jgi:hypothetical protein
VSFASLWLLLSPVVLATSPDPPTAIMPPDGAQGVPAEAVLCAQVSDPDQDLLDVTFYGRELTGPPAEDFTIVVLPDTQFYAQRHPDILHSQTGWIVAQRAARNIVFVSHVGDIVQLGFSEFEWDVADAAISRLEDPGTTEHDDGIPYGLAVGNHDQALNDDAGSLADQGATTVLFNQHFGVPRFENRGYYGGHFGTNNDNSYQLFRAGGMDFIALHLEFDETPPPSDLRGPVLDWADALLKTHADRRAIVTSHHLLCETQTCPSDPLTAPFSEQGQAIYDELKDNPNLFLMLCGHGGLADLQPRRLDVFEGSAIHTLQSCYHFGNENCPFLCGNGYLRIMIFEPRNDRISVQTYSPWLDLDKTDPYNQFVVDYDMNGGLHFREIGSVQGVASGLSPCVSWTGLDPDAEYEWYVDVSDGTDTTTGSRWAFTNSGLCDDAADCDDGDPCTIDACPAAICTHGPIADCCVEDSDCDDGNWCTDDLCAGGSCAHADNAKPCHDGDPCTEHDLCADGSCAGTAVDCDDGNACTEDSCIDGTCQSTYMPLPSCCSPDEDCHDGNPCTSDFCDNQGDCHNVVLSGCCLEDAECVDVDLCTADLCTPRNLGALALTSTYDHVTMLRRGMPGSVAEYPGLNASEFTVECWFKWTGLGVNADTSGYGGTGYDDGGISAIPLVAKGIVDSEDHPENPWLDGLTSVNYFLGIKRPGYVLAADFEEHPSGPDPHQNHPVIGTSIITHGVWRHVAATYDGSCWQLYLNGQPETDGTNCPMVPPAYESLHFFSVGVGQGWDGIVMGSYLGLIDEVRVWNRALSQQEIQANMYSQVRAHPDLLGRWGFDDPGLQTDTTGNGNLGLLVGAGIETDDLVDLGGGECEFRTPGGVNGLVLEPGIFCEWFHCDVPPTFTKLRWEEPAPVGLSYDVAYGLVGDLQSDGGTDLAECLVDDNVDPYYKDTGPDPPPGQGYYYMVREQGPCGAGPYGPPAFRDGRMPLDACP